MNIHLYLLLMRTRDGNKELAIRQKALELIVKEGIEGFSMQKLAKAAGVSPATSYIYFKDKEDLIMHLFEEESQRMADATVKNLDPGMSFKDGLRVQWVNRAHYCMKYPKQMHFLEQIRHSPLSLKCQHLVGEAFKITMEVFVTNAIKKKELIKLPMEVYWSVAFAPLYNLVKFHQAGQSIGGNKFTFSDKIMTQTLELVVKALKP
jgi:AcrR family transcriptional regulator